MDLTSHHPFWFIRNGLLHTYPPLVADASCEILIIGAGITGALMAERLSREGHDVIVIDRRDVGLGSTSASTALLQYEIDLPLVDMASRIGKDHAERAYRFSYRSIDLLNELAASLQTDVGYGRRTSLYVAHTHKSNAMLQEETAARLQAGVRCRYLSSGELAEQYHLDAKGAIVSDQAAACDAYRMTHALLQCSMRAGARVFDRTDVIRIHQRKQPVVVETDRDCTIRAERVIFATGYETPEFLREKVVRLRSTYALVSQPLESVAPWDPDWIMWEAADPYLYFRCTSDGRLLAGGEDDNFRNPRLRDRRLPRKTERIARKLRKMFPDLTWEIEFSWAGTFGTTDDGLAYIGPSPEYPHCYFALGFGGNGITFSVIAAEVLVKMVRGETHPDAELFRFGR